MKAENLDESTGENDRFSSFYQYLRQNGHWYQYWKMLCASHGELNDSCTDPWNDFDAEAEYDFQTLPPMNTDQVATQDQRWLT
jgi:hypothetical protein